MSFNFNITTPAGTKDFSVEAGDTLFFVGANGSGKTRLAVHVEQQLSNNCHRIAAHRAQTLNLSIPKIARNKAENGLFFGHENYNNASQRPNGRWGSKSETFMLNDYDKLLQVLFAEQNDTALNTHQSVRSGTSMVAKETRFEVLQSLWDRLLPHRGLRITGDNIFVIPPSGNEYSAELMSDGERAIFYLIGQVLCAPDSSLIIFDEPELHIHRSILSSLWDELQSARLDCAFMMISHDLEFIATRAGQKFVIESYEMPSIWDFTDVPEDTGFGEQLATLILGSRRPILFIEGGEDSLDIAIYRNCYPEWTVVPRGACESVIHSVKIFTQNSKFTRIGCAGIIDADDRTSEEITNLESVGVYALPVSEIENVILLPGVAKAICKLEACDAAETTKRTDELTEAVFAFASEEKNQKQTIVDYVRRRIDRLLKKIDLSDFKNLSELSAEYTSNVAMLDPATIGLEFTQSLNEAITNKDLEALVKLFDNKGLFPMAAKHLTGKNKGDFQAWLMRQLRNKDDTTLLDAFKGEIPTPSGT